MTRTRAEINDDLAAKNSEMIDLNTALSLADRQAKPAINARKGQLSEDIRRLRVEAAQHNSARRQRVEAVDALYVACEAAEVALATCYDVVEWPGKRFEVEQHKALATVRAALAKAREVSP